METPYRHRPPIWADEFRCSASYQNFRSRGTPDWLLILTVGGSGRVHSSGDEITTKPGSVILFEPHALQSYRTDPETNHWHLLWAHFQPRPHWNEWLRWPRAGKGLMEVQLSDPVIKKEFRRALSDSTIHGRQGFGDMALNALERGLLWIHSSEDEKPVDERIRKAADLLLENINSAFSIDNLATQCGLSPSRLAHLFREQIGTSPGLYLEQLRLDRAAQFLRSSNLSVSEIAEATGYANAFYFSNRFKKRFGKSPSDYRRHIFEIK